MNKVKQVQEWTPVFGGNTWLELPRNIPINTAKEYTMSVTFRARAIPYPMVLLEVVDYTGTVRNIVVQPNGNVVSSMKTGQVELLGVVKKGRTYTVSAKDIQGFPYTSAACGSGTTGATQGKFIGEITELKMEQQDSHGLYSVLALELIKHQTSNPSTEIVRDLAQGNNAYIKGESFPSLMWTPYKEDVAMGIQGVSTITEAGLAIFTLNGTDEDEYIEWSSDLPNGKVGEYRYDAQGEAMPVLPLNPLKYTAEVPLEYLDSKSSFYVSATGTNYQDKVQTVSHSGVYDIVSPEAPIPYVMNLTAPDYFVSPAGKGSVDFNIESTYPEDKYIHRITHITSGSTGYLPPERFVVDAMTYTLDFDRTDSSVIGYWSHSVSATVIEKSTNKVVDSRGYVLWEGQGQDSYQILWNDDLRWDDDSLWTENMTEEEIQAEIKEWLKLADLLKSNGRKERNHDAK